MEMIELFNVISKVFQDFELQFQNREIFNYVNRILESIRISTLQLGPVLTLLKQDKNPKLLQQ